jgi:mono/diheme cytochrome c family protein
MPAAQVDEEQANSIAEYVAANLKGH